MAEVWIPTQMQRLTGGVKQVQVQGRTVRQVLDGLERLFPGFKEHVYDEEDDRIRPEIAVIVDGEVSQLGLLTQVTDESEVHFLPAIGGGTASA
jgi:molybdopterin synthase sulfur carrier subunit